MSVIRRTVKVEVMGVDDANASGIADTNSAKGDGANSGRDSILSRKLKKIVECDLEADVELQEALQELSIFFPENTLRTRRFLRGDVERRSLHISREFLSELDGVRQAVNEVADVFVSLTHSAQAMQRQLEATKAKTRDLIRQTSALQAEGQALAVQEATVHQFIVDYQLTVEQMTSLREGDVGDQFFSALDRAQDIHRNCKGLLQSGQHSTALEVMDQMSQFQEAALERLYRWAQSQCRTVDTPRARPDQGGGGDLLARAMRHLLRRPVMFRYVLDEYCSARRAVLVRTFIDALTAGGPGGTPKPIELHAHDPPRYIGDMLAWLHQAIPGEKENAMSLLKLCKDPPPPTEAAEGTEAPPAADVAQLCEEALASVTEEVCRPLRTRVEQILLLEQSPLVLHRLSSLVRFYMGTIKQIIPETGALLQTLADLDQLAYKQFLSVLQTTVHQHLSLTAPNSSTNGPAGGSNVVAAAAAASGPSVHDLAPTRSSTALLNLLKEILSTSSVVDEQESQLAEIVSSVVDPILDDVASIASTLPTTDADVFQLNSIYQVRKKC